MIGSSDLRPWISPSLHRPLSRPALRLLCFPHAGAGASIFRGWPEALPPLIDVLPIQLPGRESRWAEPRFEDLAVLAQVLCDGLRPLFSAPYALFGHSMGALIAFELARELRRQGLPLPTQLFISGARPPHLPDPGPKLHRLPDSLLWSRVARAYGDGEDGATLDPQLAPVLLPLLRSDLKMCENYQPETEKPFSLPITVYGGRRDRRVAESDLSSWQRHTLERLKTRLFPGGHFYLASDPSAFLKTFARDLASAVKLSSSTPCTLP